jgi:hypothetical protein
MKTHRMVIRYRAQEVIGRAAAEEDGEFLRNCFISTESLAAILNTDSPQSILLGRTGSGKTASLWHITETQRHVITIEPEHLALTYISNYDILAFFEAVGVKLDVFYQLLWRHVLCIELLNYVFHLNKPAGAFRSWLAELVATSAARAKAIEYLERWNSKFWADTEERIKEITETLESKLQAAASINTYALSLSASTADTISAEVKKEIISRGQKVVNEVQIQQLAEVMKIIDADIFSQLREPYFVVIDKLDEDWIDDIRRYKLLRALIETIKRFRAVHNLKIIIALRSDFIERVYRNTQDSGFQEEKYEDLHLRIRRSGEQLFALMSRRIAHLMESVYTKRDVSFYDVFPVKVAGHATADYIIDRTLLRPRDVIAFVNEILGEAEGHAEITEKIILDAEANYSRKRLQALCHEWIVDHPRLVEYFALIKKQGSRFSFVDIDEVTVHNVFMKIIDTDADGNKRDSLCELVDDVCQDIRSMEECKSEVLKILYKIGVLGVKLETYMPFTYSQAGPAELSSDQISNAVRFEIHPMLWRALGVHRDRGSGTAKRQVQVA